MDQIRITLFSLKVPNLVEPSSKKRNKHANNDSGSDSCRVPAIADLLTVIGMMLLHSALCVIKYTLKPFWFISSQRVSICLRLVTPLNLLLVLHVDRFLELT